MSEALESLKLFTVTIKPDPFDERDVSASWIRKQWAEVEPVIREALEQTSTAEAQARALEDAEILEFMERTRPTITNGPEGWSTTVRHMNSFGSGATLREAILQTMEHEQGRADAKRIREEG